MKRAINSAFSLTPFLLIVLVVFSIIPYAQQANGPTHNEHSETDHGTISTSGTSIFLPNAIGTIVNNFGVNTTGSPASFTVTVYGCMADNTTCSASLGTTSTNATIVTTTVPYDTYKVTATWTGGTSPTVKITRTGFAGH